MSANHRDDDEMTKGATGSERVPDVAQGQTSKGYVSRAPEGCESYGSTEPGRSEVIHTESEVTRYASLLRVIGTTKRRWFK